MKAKCTVCGREYNYERGNNCTMERCNSCYIAGNRKLRKQTAVDLFGGKCQKCGYDRSLSALTFHHLEKKEFALSTGITVSWQRYVVELEKCVLLCCRCHTEVHDGLWDANELPRVKVPDEFRNLKIPTGRERRKAKPLIRKKCSVCDKDFDTKLKSQICCSRRCAAKKHRKRKVDVDKELLGRLLWEMPTTQIAVVLGITDSAVAKIAKQYGLNKPPRGYWSQVKA